jgi:hypothetical protein
MRTSGTSLVATNITPRKNTEVSESIVYNTLRTLSGCWIENLSVYTLGNQPPIAFTSEFAHWLVHVELTAAAGSRVPFCTLVFNLLKPSGNFTYHQV